jgi:hypothetical protein
MIPLVFTTAFAFFQGKQRVIAAATIGGLASLAPTLGPTVGAGSRKILAGTGCFLSISCQAFILR